MEQLVKFPSLQASFSTNASGFAGAQTGVLPVKATASKNLVDMEIPANIGIVDLSRSAVVVSLRNNSVPTASAGLNTKGVMNVFPELIKTGNYAGLVQSNSDIHSTAVFVRNASMFNARRGKIEEIKEVQCLRGNLSRYTRNDEDVNSSKNKSTDLGQKVSFPAEAGNDIVGEGIELSRNQDYELRIPLSDVFDFCNNPAYDTSDGITKLHFEFHFDKLIFGVKTTANNVANGFVHKHAHNAQGNVFPQVFMSDMEMPQTANQRDNTTGGNVNITDPLITRATYPDLRACPYYVGQQVNQTINIQDSANPHGNAGDLGDNIRVITAIGRPTAGGGDGGGLNKDKVQITLSNENIPVLPNGRRIVPAPARSVRLQLDRMVANADNYVRTNAQPVQINSVELQCLIDPQADKVSNFTYVEYKSEQDTYSPRQELVRNYEVPPNCRSVYVFFSPNEKESEQPNLVSYRVSIDNEDIIGRRVNVGSTLDLDLKNGTLTNSGLRVRSLEEKVQNVFGMRSTNTDVGTRMDAIMFPVPLKANSQRLTLDLLATGGGQNLLGHHIIYYECLKSY